MMSKSSPNCDQAHIHQLLDLLCYYRILQVSNEEEAKLEMRLNIIEALLVLGASPRAPPRRYQREVVKDKFWQNGRGLHCHAVRT